MVGDGAVHMPLTHAVPVQQSDDVLHRPFIEQQAPVTHVRPLQQSEDWPHMADGMAQHWPSVHWRPVPHAVPPQQRWLEAPQGPVTGVESMAGASLSPRSR